MHMSLNTHYCSQQEEMYLTSLIGSDTTLLPSQEGEKIPLFSLKVQPMGDCHSSGNEKITVLLSFSFLQWILHLQQPLPRS